MTAPGWYNAQGDPPGTTRYWDGMQWIGDPVATPPAPIGVGGSLGGAQLASPGARIGARLIDIIIFLVLSVVVLASFLGDVIEGFDVLGPNPTDSQVQAVFEEAFDDARPRLVVLAIATLVWDWLWVAFAAGTPGKLMLGLRVADEATGATPPGIAKAFRRSLNRAISLLGIGGAAASNAVSGIGMLIGLISLIMLFADGRHRTAMDYIGGTVVIKK